MSFYRLRDITMKNVIITIFISLLTLSTAQAAHPQCGKTELSSLMDEMKDSMKAIKTAVKASNTAEVTLKAQYLLTQVKDASAYVPLTISDKKDLSAGQQKQFVDYKKGLEQLESAVEALVVATTAKEQKQALGKIGKAAKSGHKEYKMDCDE
jgi:hypothetical protein